MAEELLVVLNRKDNSGLGFSLLGKPGLPPIIYNIIEDSPAAESGEKKSKPLVSVQPWMVVKIHTLITEHKVYVSDISPMQKEDARFLTEQNSSFTEDDHMPLVL
ncbi:hypothetical protein FQR65_LT09803 [Abscondita terminalis]|nr:hypothetical protein FQR65_LT09803 [Abscondita terminalis]